MNHFIGEDFTAGTVFGVLLNEAETLDRLAATFREPPYNAPPVAPVLYIKPRNTFAGEGAAVVVPGAVRVDATVGAVIGRRASGVTAGQALAHVKGYVVVSDLTLAHDAPRDSYYRPAVRLRCRDGFCPMSGLIVEAFDASQATITVRINDAQVHQRSLRHLVHDLSHLIEAITAFITLDENDVVLVGPPDAAPVAEPGDAIAIAVSGLGGLTHTLIAEVPA